MGNEKRNGWVLHDGVVAVYLTGCSGMSCDDPTAYMREIKTQEARLAFDERMLDEEKLFDDASWRPDKFTDSPEFKNLGPPTEGSAQFVECPSDLNVHTVPPGADLDAVEATIAAHQARDVLFEVIGSLSKQGVIDDVSLPEELQRTISRLSPAPGE